MFSPLERLEIVRPAPAHTHEGDVQLLGQAATSQERGYAKKSQARARESASELAASGLHRLVCDQRRTDVGHENGSRWTSGVGLTQCWGEGFRLSASFKRTTTARLWRKLTAWCLGRRDRRKSADRPVQGCSRGPCGRLAEIAYRCTS